MSKSDSVPFSGNSKLGYGKCVFLVGADNNAGAHNTARCALTLELAASGVRRPI